MNDPTIDPQRENPRRLRPARLLLRIRASSRSNETVPCPADRRTGASSCRRSRTLQQTNTLPLRDHAAAGCLSMNSDVRQTQREERRGLFQPAEQANTPLFRSFIHTNSNNYTEIYARDNFQNCCGASFKCWNHKAFGKRKLKRGKKFLSVVLIYI